MKSPNMTIGTGPCSKWFKGEECPFYPELTIRQEFKASCTDARGSYCECIWFCWNNNNVFESLDKLLNVKGYDLCTDFFEVKSTDEALAWKEKQCKDSKGSNVYKKNEKQCMKNKDKGNFDSEPLVIFG